MNVGLSLTIYSLKRHDVINAHYHLLLSSVINMMYEVM